MKLITYLLPLLLAFHIVAQSDNSDDSDDNRERRFLPKSNFEDVCLQSHNEARKRKSVPLLVWDDNLADTSKSWSEHMAQTKKFYHDSNRGKGIGENIAYIGNSKSEEDSWKPLFKLWLDEESITDLSKPAMKFCTTSKECGHWTAMIWSTTTKVGCGIASDSKGYRKYLTCRYSPSGNRIGEYAIPKK